GRRVVRRVWVVEMNPREERLGPIRLGRTCQPPDGGIRDLIRAALAALLAGVALVKLLVEGIESLIEAKRGGDRIGADERSRAVASLLEACRQRRMSPIEAEHDVVADAVHGWILAGQDRCVRRPGERRRG